MALKIKNVFAYEILDSRGFPTVACIVKVGSTGFGKNREASAKAMVPSGASTGQKEALELRDGDKNRYGGKGVKKAVMNVNQILGPELMKSEVNPEDQAAVDKFLIELDGTDNKSTYGANAILAVSLAVAKAVARFRHVPFYRYVSALTGAKDEHKLVLPLPMINVINGGEHADNTIDFQEFMFMPVGAHSIHEAVRIGSECFHALQGLLKSKGFNTNKGDEGGFAPNLRSAEEALSIMMQAIDKAGYKAGILHGQVAFALDCAASELYDKETKLYSFKKAIAARILTKEKGTKTTDQMVDYLVSLVEKFPIISIEDGLDETDWDGWAKLVQRLGDRVQLVGDDLFCTNPRITAEGVQKKVANSVLVKVNQIGTLTETLETVKLAKDAGWTSVLSHRSGETEDSTIADLAVGTSCGQIKTGSMSRSERIAKYNRLLEIEMELNKEGSAFKGLHSFVNLDVSNEELFKEHTFRLTDSEKNLSLLLDGGAKKGKKGKGKGKRKSKKQVKPLVAVVEEVAPLLGEDENLEPKKVASKKGKPKKGAAKKAAAKSEPKKLTNKPKKATKKVAGASKSKKAAKK